MQYNGYNVGPVLRELRKAKCLTIDKVCEITGISTSTLSQLEQGGRNLSMRNLYVLMDVYEVDANTILAITPSKNKDSIDERLSRLPQKQRDYFASSFIFMLERVVQYA